MIEITLKDGSTKKYKKRISAYSIAEDISESLARNVLSAQFQWCQDRIINRDFKKWKIKFLYME